MIEPAKLTWWRVTADRDDGDYLQKKDKFGFHVASCSPQEEKRLREWLMDRQDKDQSEIIVEDTEYTEFWDELLGYYELPGLTAWFAGRTTAILFQQQLMDIVPRDLVCVLPRGNLHQTIRDHLRDVPTKWLLRTEHKIVLSMSASEDTEAILVLAQLMYGEK